MDQQTIVGLIVMVIVAVLGFVFRYWKPIAPLDDWLEMGLSLIGGIVLAALFGQLAPFVGWSDPVAAVEWVLVAAAVVFGFTKLVYAAVKKAFPDSGAASVLKVKRL